MGWTIERAELRTTNKSVPEGERSSVHLRPKRSTAVDPQLSRGESIVRFRCTDQREIEQKRAPRYLKACGQIGRLFSFATPPITHTTDYPLLTKGQTLRKARPGRQPRWMQELPATSLQRQALCANQLGNNANIRRKR
jgi:hypothetical protein